jgi:DNA processing protein
MRSGSLITARLANEMGRDIFALPGSIHAPLSRGCHRIIKQGAKLVETSDEVLEELGFARSRVAGAARVATKAHASGVAAATRTSPAATSTAPQRELAFEPASGAAQQHAGPAPPATTLAPDAQRLLAALGHSPTTLEILASRTEMEDAALHTTLLQLELAGEISVLPGGRFVRTGRNQAGIDRG